MASKNFYYNIVFRTLLLGVSALAMGWLFFGIQLYALAGVIALTFIAQIIETINYLNRTNRKIAFFFDAVRNDDSTLHFPVNTGNKSLDDLNESLNKLNELIKTIKFDLHEQEQYFKTILEQVSIGVITFNQSGNIFLSNSAAKHLLMREQLTHINQLTQVDKNLLSAFKELLPGGHKLVSFNSPNGTVQLSLKSSAFKTTTDNLQLVAIQDIKNEMESKELESWIKLIRVLTHEIMNTIAPITSLSQTISGYFKKLDGKIPDEKTIGNTVKGLEIINERGNGLISFVENYRQLTRLPQPDKKKIALKPFFENTATLLQIDPKNNNTQIDWDCNPADLEIFADEKQIAQVLINLLKNAQETLKNQENGKILIKAEINKNGRPQIAVTDNGLGIPNDLLDKIFVPFFSTKENGSGIGLSLSRQIMQMHGGLLKVKSLPQKTIFSIVF
jgi:nitrogen fixation/metabolism regulation signal transduction histidine kinase